MLEEWLIKLLFGSNVFLRPSAKLNDELFLIFLSHIFEVIVNRTDERKDNANAEDDIKNGE